MLVFLELLGGVFDLLSWPGGGSERRRRRSVWYRLTQLAVLAGAVYFTAAEWSRSHDGSETFATFLVAVVALAIAAWFASMVAFALSIVLGPLWRPIASRRRRRRKMAAEPKLRYVAGPNADPSSDTARG